VRRGCGVLGFVEKGFSEGAALVFLLRASGSC